MLRTFLFSSLYSLAFLLTGNFFLVFRKWILKIINIKLMHLILLFVFVCSICNLTLFFGITTEFCLHFLRSNFIFFFLSVYFYSFGRFLFWLSFLRILYVQIYFNLIIITVSLIIYYNLSFSYLHTFFFYHLLPNLTAFFQKLFIRRQLLF